MKPRFNRFLAASVTSVIVFSSSTFAAVIWKDSSTDPLNSTTSWWTTETGTTDPVSIGTADTLRFGGSGQGASMTTLLLGGNLTVGALRLDNNTGTPNYNVTIAAGNTLTLNGNNDYTTGLAQGIVLNSSTGGTLTINSNIVIGASQRWVAARNLNVGGNVDLGANTLSFHAAGGTTTVSGIISGTGGITTDFSLGGTVVLTGANDYEGTTTLNFGTIRVTGSGVLGGKTGSITDANNIVFGAANNSGTLEFQTSANLGAADQIRFRNTGGTAGSGGKLNYIGTTAQTMSKTIFSDSSIGIRLGSDSVGGSITYNGSFSMSAARPLFLEGTGTGDNTLAAAFAGTSITKSGAGKWVLTGANNYSGTTKVTGGTLQFAKAVSLYNAGTSNWTAANINVASGATLALNVDSAGTNGFTATNIDTLLGNISVAGSPTTGLQAGATLGLDTSTATGATFTQGNAFADSTGANGGALGLTKLGTGTLILDKSNTYTGTTTISGGVLQLNNANAVQNSTVSVGLANGLQFGTGIGTFNIGSLTGSGDVLLADTGATAVTLSIGGNNATPAAYTGVLSGSGSVTKVGTGTLALNQTNTFTGGLLINAGAVTTNNNNGFGGFGGLTPTITLGSGASAATLTLTSSVVSALRGNITVAAGAGDRFFTSSSTGATLTSSSASSITLNKDLKVAVTGGSAGSLTIAGTVSGAGGLIVDSTNVGTVILSNANTYSGGSVVNSGELQALTTATAGAKTTLGSNAITVNSGAAVRFKSASTGNAQSYANAINLNGGTLISEDGVVTYGGAVALTGNNTINVVYSGKNAIISNTISGSGSIIKTNLGDLTFTGANTYTGKTSVQNATMNVTTLNSVTGGVASSSLGAPVTIANGTIALGSGGNSGILNVISAGETTDRVLDFAGTTGGAQVFNNGTGLLRFTSNTSTTGSGAKGHTFGGAGSIQLDGNIVSLGGLTNITKSGGGTLTLGGNLSLATGSLNSNGGILQLASTSSSVSGVNMALTRDNTAGLGGVLKIASGANVFSSTANANGILGGWATFGGNTWAVTNGNASAITGLASFTSDWTTSTGNADITASNTSGALTVNSLRFNTAGALTQTLSGANVVTSGGILVTSNVGANDITITGGTSLNGGGQDLIIHQNNTAGALNIATGLAARITKSGAGTVNLSGNNTYGGNTVINEGVLNITAGGLYLNSAGAAVFTNTAVVTINSAGTLKLNSFAYGGTVESVVGTTGGLGDNRNRRVLNGGAIEVVGSTHSSGNNFTVNAIGGTFRYNPTTTTDILTLAGNAGTNIQLDGTLKYDAIGNITVNEQMDGLGGITKTGAGTLIFSQANSYSGLTRVENGKLTVTGTLLNTSGLTVNSGATAELGATNMFTSGHGTAMDSSRVLTVNNGTLLMTGNMVSRIGNVTLNNGSTWTSNQGLTNYDILLADTSTGAATVSVTGNAASTMNGSGGIHLQGVQNFAVADVTSSSATDLTVSMILANAGSSGGSNGGINKTGSGTMLLSGNNTFTGAVNVNGGIIKMGGSSGTTSLGSLNTAVTKVVVGSGGTIDFNGVADVTYGYTIAGTGADGTGAIINTGAAIGTGSKQASNIKLSANASIGGSGNWALLASGYAATSLDLNAFTLTKTGTNTVYLTNTTITAGSIRVSQGKLGTVNSGAVGTSTALILDDIANAGLDLGENLTIGSLAGGGATGGNTSIASGKSLTVGALNTNTTYSGVISGSGAVTKTGTGSLSLSRGNTYSGGTTVSNGVLDLTGGGGGSGTIRGTATVNTGGMLRLSTNDSTGYNNDATRLSIVNLVGGELNVNTTGGAGNNQTFRGTINMTGGSITGLGGSTFDLFGNGSAINTIASSTTSIISGTSLGLRQDDSTFTVATGTTSSGVDLLVSSALTSGSSTIEGNHNFVKAGTGKMALTGTNTYTGLTTISAGTLQIGNGSTTGSIASTSGVTNNATLAYNRSDALTVGYAISGSGALQQLGAGTTTLTNANSYTGATTISAGTLQIGNGSTTGSIAGTTGVTNNATLAYNRSDALTVGYAITGSGVVNQIGGGTTTLTNTNTYTGATTISAGTLQIGNGGTTGSIASTSGVTNNATLAYNRSDALTVGYAISGSGALKQLGAGTTTLTNTNTYTGITEINAGKLVINGDNSAATGAVTVAAILAGTGTIGGATTILADGIHGPGNSPGVQTFSSDLTYNGGSIFSWDLASLSESGRGTVFDGVNVGGDLTIDSTASTGSIFQVVLGTSGSESNSFWNTSRSWNVFNVTGSITGAFTNFSVVDSSFSAVTIGSPGSFTFNGGTGALNWTAVPEPTSALAGLLLGAGLLRRRRVA